MRIVSLFSLVLGYSRYIFARFVMHQNLQTLLRCHVNIRTWLTGLSEDFDLVVTSHYLVGTTSQGVRRST